MDGYFLGLDELDENIKGIRAGSNIMLLGPPMSGKRPSSIKLFLVG